MAALVIAAAAALRTHAAEVKLSGTERYFEPCDEPLSVISFEPNPLNPKINQYVSFRPVLNYPLCVFMYYVDFGDGSNQFIGEGYPSAYHQYTIPGTYNVNFYAYETGGSSVNVTIQVVVSPEQPCDPIAVEYFNLSTEVAEVGEPVTMQYAVTPSNCLGFTFFAFGEGGLFSFGNPATFDYSYRAPGVYNVTMSVEDKFRRVVEFRYISITIVEQLATPTAAPPTVAPPTLAPPTPAPPTAAPPTAAPPTAAPTAGPPEACSGVGIGAFAAERAEVPLGEPVVVSFTFVSSCFRNWVLLWGEVQADSPPATGTSRSATLSNVYPREGVYLVGLSGFDTEGRAVSKVISVSVVSASCPPIALASFSAASSIVAVNTEARVSFEFVSSCFSEWRVVWGDGSPIGVGTAKAGTLSHTYTQDGVYLVAISGFDSKGVAVSQSLAITVGTPCAGPVLDKFEVSPRNAAVGDVVEAVYQVSSTCTRDITINWGDGKQVVMAALAQAGAPSTDISTQEASSSPFLHSTPKVAQ
eukprot:CAMPEP_0185842404 /NCGR_PEP_ID=MMETSP1353-20130828/18389_1 /TAXON_ID=1077150 /ORGANISM="Erythrolobus australicus, Strain CCMP3124" /LENGTH=526 /DNA_ID=CAMNT_0028541905 /DNA_START=82 /DNA_END=1663 /DNA_ORIENTATION=+